MTFKMNPLLPARYLGTLFSLILLLSAPLPALEFRVLSWHGGLDGIFLLQGANRIPLLGDGINLSERKNTPPGEQLTLYREVMVETRLVPVAVATLPIPKDYARAILVVSQNLEYPNLVSGFWLNDTLNDFPVGSFIFHNRADFAVALKVEETVHLLDQLASWHVGFLATTSRTRATVAIRDGEAVRLILNQSLKTHPRYRILLIFRNGRPNQEDSDEIDMPVEYLMIYDYEPPDNPSESVSAF